ncbi:DUF305 domain-containing protein [Modestobacter muralis]|uniref:DUF305 domain-containing protein n=1 Tax=Modestobacter muralis TaxID=1608614 RepID=A0A6P0EVS7_9ACTN|nr:DUF305 domain-containing protein [Modestobacter muralis]NEK93388.1 DUF305 domain-containing protein [Modestobacter muralis]NEN50155.1 DUF305 domain-containing protein [Modestobacter muralis]
MTRTNLRRARLSAGLIAGVVVLAGCSNGSDDSTAASGSGASSSAPASASASASADFNDADVAFVQGMLPHHEGALEMAKLAEGRAEDPRVLDLASRIEAAQEPEIETMTGWLQAWGQPASDDMGGMDMGGMDMGGMDMDMSGLEAASGTEFDRMFLEMMTEHHRGAVDMAETEIADGQNADAIALAREISTSQTAEIEEMQTLLTELGS